MAVKKGRKLSGLVVYSNLKNGASTAVKMVLNLYMKGVPFANKILREQIASNCCCV